VAGTATGDIEGLSDDDTLVVTVDDDFAIASSAAPAATATHTTTFPTLSFSKEGTYEFSVREKIPSAGVPAGWEFDTDAVTVEISVARSSADPNRLAAKVTYRYAKDDGDATADNVHRAAFTNRFIAVSHLPLSGSWSEVSVLGTGAFVLTAGAAALVVVLRAPRAHLASRASLASRTHRTRRRTTR
jgi:pilin isopeptide linkage protein